MPGGYVEEERKVLLSLGWEIKKSYEELVGILAGYGKERITGSHFRNQRWSSKD